MKDVLALFFIVIAVIQAGLVAMSFAVLRDNKDIVGRAFWWGASLSSLLAALAFAIGLIVMSEGGQPHWIYTPGNTLYLLSGLSMLLFCRSLNQPLAQRELKAFAVFSVFWMFGFEYLRRTGTFYDRSVYIMVPLVTASIWQIVALRTAIDHRKSRQLRVLQAVTFVELLLLLARLLAVHTPLLPAQFTASQLPQLLVVLVLMQLGVSVLSLSAVNGYWLELVSEQEKTTAVENQRILELLLEKETLIESLSRLHKVAETGALSASLAHEINQPLSAVHLDVQMLKVLVQGGSAPDQMQPYLDRIGLNNARATDTIASLRQLFGGQAAEPVARPVDPLIKQAVAWAQGGAKASSAIVDMRLAAPQPSLVLPGDLQMVIINLLNNAFEALKQMPGAGGRISVRSWHEGSSTVIEVADNGPGLPPHLQGEVFNLLKSGSAHGMGLGLWLSRYLIERQGGQLTHQTRSGACLRIELQRSLAQV
jgi:signal transduction histidine kinase